MQTFAEQEEHRQDEGGKRHHIQRQGMAHEGDVFFDFE
jgi:hypothetical protein